MKKLMQLLLRTATILPILTLLLLPAISRSRQAAATDLSGLFTKGNNLYKEGNYAEALKSYEQILAATGNLPIVLYNAGNAAAKTNNPGKAVLYYERARRLLPRDTDIVENLSKVEPATNRRSSFFLFRPLFFIRDFFTQNELTVIADALLFLVFFFLTLLLLAKSARLQRTARTLIKVTLPLFLIALIFFGWRVYNQDIARQAVVIADKAIARSGPGEQFLEVLELPAGTKVRIVDSSSPDWVRIRLRDGRSGYLQSTACQQI